MSITVFRPTCRNVNNKSDRDGGKNTFSGTNSVCQESRKLRESGTSNKKIGSVVESISFQNMNNPKPFMKFSPLSLLLLISMSLGLTFFASFAEAKPPSHAPAHGYRRNQGEDSERFNRNDRFGERRNRDRDDDDDRDERDDDWDDDWDDRDERDDDDDNDRRNSERFDWGDILNRFPGRDR